jgi:hypothetical protein
LLSWARIGFQSARDLREKTSSEPNLHGISQAIQTYHPQARLVDVEGPELEIAHAAWKLTILS